MHFKYINAIRDKDGKLREWKEYDKISRFEEGIDKGKIFTKRKYFDSSSGQYGRDYLKWKNDEK